LCRRVALRRGELTALVDEEVRHLAPLSTPADQRRLAREAIARLSGLGDLEALVADPTIDEVLVNDGREIWVERAGALERVGLLDGQPVEHLIERILAPIGRRLDRTTPIVDARLASGARVCAVVPPVAVDGTSLSIRRFSPTIRPLESFTDDAGHDMCRTLIDERCNIVVCGATSSGKTSLLASLTTLIPDGERVLVLEDTAELPVAGRHTIRLEARPATADLPTAVTLEQLVRTALRLRPDRLVVGEIRGPEVLGLVQAMNTGHDGSFSTCHANSPVDSLLRLESLVLQAAPTWPLVAIRQQLARSIDVVVHVARHGDGQRRIDSISEVCVPDAADSLTAPELRVLGRNGPQGFERQGDLERGRAAGGATAR
jgi:pilus assembly protein CpaF